MNLIRAAPVLLALTLCPSCILAYEVTDQEGAGSSDSGGTPPGPGCVAGTSEEMGLCQVFQGYAPPLTSPWVCPQPPTECQHGAMPGCCDKGGAPNLWCCAQ